MQRHANAKSIGAVCFSIALLAAAGCDGPFIVMPGGALTGSVVDPPERWAPDGDYGTAQLETHAIEPYSVNIAYTVQNGTLYVNAGDSETQWVKNMNGDPFVRLRIDGVLYELRAERVENEGEIARFGEAWTAQSMFRRDPTELEKVWLYRLVARSRQPDVAPLH